MKTLFGWATLAILWIGLVFVPQADAQTARIFWAAGDYPASPGEIGVVNEDGTGLQTIHTGLAFVENLDVDGANQHIYWNERRRVSANGPFMSRIRRSDFSGTNIVDLVTVANEISGLSLDLVNNKMYWTQGNVGGPPTVERADLTGANQQTIQSGYFTPAIEADPAAGKVFWGAQSSVWHATLAGSSPQQLFTNPGDIILGLTVDPNQDVYWTSAAVSTGGVRVGDQGGTSFQPIAFPISTKLGIDYEPTVNRVFFAEKDLGQIQAFDPIGGTSQVVAFGLVKPIDVAALVIPEPGALSLAALGLLAVSVTRCGKTTRN